MRGVRVGGKQKTIEKGLGLFQFTKDKQHESRTDNKSTRIGFKTETYMHIRKEDENKDQYYAFRRKEKRILHKLTARNIENGYSQRN